MSKKNIAFLIPKLTGGGAERVVSNLSIHLNGNKYNKYLVVYNDEEIAYPVNAKIISLDINNSKNIFVKIYDFFVKIYKLREIKKKFNIDITISFLPNANLANIISRRNDKIIISVRNFISESLYNFNGKIYKILIKKFYNKADKIISVSKLIKKDLIEKFYLDSEKIKVIYNPYNIKKVASNSTEKIEEKYNEIFNNFTIITMGSLTKQKGQWHLIRAFKKVQDKHPSAQLVILGKGTLEKYLKKLVIDLGIENNVHFFGFKDNPFKYISKSSLFILPSLFEGFPNALVEAMVCKTPVIASDCKSGPREIISPNTDINGYLDNIEYGDFGILIPVFDGKFYNATDSITEKENILTDIILRFIDNDKTLTDKNYGSLGFNRASDFVISDIIKEWEKEL